jgi:AraC-like DNA-binding protein
MDQYTILKSQYFEEGFPPVFVMSAQHHGKTGLHSHEFFELVFIESGIALHSHEGNTQILTTGDVFVILPGEVHSYISANNAMLYNCLFTADALAGIEKDIAKLEGLEWLLNGRKSFTRIHAGLAEMQDIHVTLERIIWERLNRPLGWELKMKSLFESLLVTFARLYGTHGQSGDGVVANFGHIMKAVAYIESNFSRDVPLEEISKVSGLSTGYLSRQFKSVLGASPSEYCRNFRMAKAAELLRVENKSVADVSAELGFADISLFSRQFKQVTGVSPTGFRKNK